MKKIQDKVVELVGGVSVMNGAYPVQFFLSLEYLSKLFQKPRVIPRALKQEQEIISPFYYRNRDKARQVLLLSTICLDGMALVDAFFLSFQPVLVISSYFGRRRRRTNYNKKKTNGQLVVLFIFAVTKQSQMYGCNYKENTDLQTDQCLATGQDGIYLMQVLCLNKLTWFYFQT